MTPKLSIIVPIYGVEPYLRKCVDSLLAQDLSSDEYEIILVDDGGTDGCPAICDSYAKAYENIRVIHRENGGLSAARNSGIEIARGEYLMFVDSDDYLESNVLRDLVEQMKRDQLDVLRYDYQNVRFVEGRYEVFEPNKTPRYIDKCSKIVDGETYLNTRMGYSCYVAMYIIKRNLLFKSRESRVKSQDCLFMPGIHFEDIEWLPRMMLRAKHVNSTSKIVYNYVTREGSITQEGENKKKRERNVSDALTVIECLNSLALSYPKCTWLYNMRSGLTLAILNTISCYLYPKRKEYVNRLKALNVFPLSHAYGGYRTRLCNISPYVAVLFIHTYNELRKFMKKR